MNKIQKIVCLIGIMILPIDSAIAAPYGGMGEIVIFAFLLFAFIYFILMPYLAKRLISWIYGIILFIVKREWRTWNVRLLILDIPMLGIAFYLLNIMYFEPQKKAKIREPVIQFSRITLSQSQTIAGITMPAGTTLETHFDYDRKQPDPEKFSYAKFPQAIMWNNIPITSLNKNLPEIGVRSEKQVAIGKWICDKSDDITFTLLPIYDGKQLNNENFEQAFYLNSCILEKGQTVSLPSFQATFTLDSSIRRIEDKFHDVTQGFWLVHANRNDAAKAAMKIDFDKFYLTVDSKKIVHNFLIELSDAPEKHCGLPQNTLLGWRKSQPKTILVATYPTQNVPQKCWGRKLQKISVDEMRDALPKQNNWYLNMAKKYFESKSN